MKKRTVVLLGAAAVAAVVVTRKVRSREEVTLQDGEEERGASPTEVNLPDERS